MPVYTTAKIHGNTWQFTNTWQSIFLNILALSHPSILEFLCFLTLVVFFFICVLCFVEFLKLLLRNFLQKFSLTADICGLFSLHIMEGWKGLTGHNNLTEKNLLDVLYFRHISHICNWRSCSQHNNTFFIRLLSTSITSLMAVTQKMIFPCTS